MPLAMFPKFLKCENFLNIKIHFCTSPMSKSSALDVDLLKIFDTL